MALILSMYNYKRGKTLYWKGNHKLFVTLCDDGNVILDGHVMSLSEATSLLMRKTGVPPSLFWEREKDI